MFQTGQTWLDVQLPPIRSVTSPRHRASSQKTTPPLLGMARRERRHRCGEHLRPRPGPSPSPRPPGGWGSGYRPPRSDDQVRVAIDNEGQEDPRGGGGEGGEGGGEGGGGGEERGGGGGGGERGGGGRGGEGEGGGGREEHGAFVLWFESRSGHKPYAEADAEPGAGAPRRVHRHEAASHPAQGQPAAYHEGVIWPSRGVRWGVSRNAARGLSSCSVRPCSWRAGHSPRHLPVRRPGRPGRGAACQLSPAA